MKRRPIDFLALCFGGLIIFGLIALASASSVWATQDKGEPFYYFTHQLLYGLLPGLIGFVAARTIPLKFFQVGAPFFYIASIVLLGLVFVPGLHYEYGGARRWLDLGSFSFQPSEMAKIGVILFLASWLARQGRQKLSTWRFGVLPFIALTGVPLILILLEPDVGTAAILAATTGLMYFAAGARWRHLVILFIAALLMVGSVVALSPHRWDRIETFFNPNQDTLKSSYQINQSLVAIGSGGLFGRGLGQSRQKYSYLPEPAGDTIFAIIAEELGFAATILLVLVYLAIAYLGARAAAVVQNDFSKYLILGIIGLIVIQAFINMMAVTAILPFTGVPLPFISYGGTALATLITSLGLVFSAATGFQGSAKKRY